MEVFNAEQFARDLNAGKFNGAVHLELATLTFDQLQEVADVLIRLIEERKEAAWC